MPVMEDSEVRGVTLDPVADRKVMRDARVLAAATARFRAARSAYIPALQALLDVADAYAEAQQQLVDAYRAAKEPNRELTLGRAWLSSLPVDGLDFRALAFRAQERRCAPDGMLRP
jgi:hypothetical protein